jgi:hypothetical protein
VPFWRLISNAVGEAGSGNVTIPALRSSVRRPFNAVAFNGTTYVGASNTGVVYVSTDSLDTVTEVQLNTGENLLACVYGAGLFVVAGDNGAIFTSPDGLTWTARVSGVPDFISGGIYGGGQFVLVGTSGLILTSPDGITWTQRASGTTDWLKTVAHNGSVYVVLPLETTAVYTSSDGATWSSSVGPTSHYSFGLVYGGGVFVSVGYKTYNFEGSVFTSTNGTTWVERDVSALLSGAALNSLSYGGGLFVAGTDYDGFVVTSPDGATWTQRVSRSDTFNLRAALYDGSRHILFSGAYFMTTSDDAVSWRQISIDPFDTWANVAAYNGLFVVVGQYTSTIATSTDGALWKASPAPTFTDTPWFGVAGGGGVYVVVGQGGYILSSTDAQTWTLRTSGTTQSLQQVRHLNSNFVAVGDAGVLLTSPDGTTWTSRSSGTSSRLNSAAYGAGLYVAVGTSGTIRTSPDLVTWTSRTSGVITALQDVTFADGVFVAVGDLGVVLTSTDGITWTSRSAPTSDNFTCVAYGAGLFVVWSHAGAITSPDGITWTDRGAQAPEIESVAHDGARFVAVGQNGSVAASDDGVSWFWPGIQEGDLIVAGIASRSSEAFTLPVGWSLVATQQTSGNGNFPPSATASGVMAYVVRGATPPSRVFTRSGGSDVAISALVFRAAP